MYKLHILTSGYPYDEDLTRLGIFEISHEQLWESSQLGDFVLFLNYHGDNKYLTRVADVRRDGESQRVLLESPISISGGPNSVSYEYVRDWGADGGGYQSADDLSERLGIEFTEDSQSGSWLWNEEKYRPPNIPNPIDEPSRNPEDPGGDGGDGENGNNGDEGSDGGNGIDRTGTMLSEQYSARDAIRQAAKGTTQATILLFGVVIAGLALFEEAIRDVELLRFFAPIGLGVVLLIGALLGSAFVLVRTAAFPRPSINTLSKKHKEINEDIFDNEEGKSTGIETDALQELSSSYFTEVDDIWKRNAILGRIIGFSVAFATVGSILVFYGALVLGVNISFTTPLLGEWWILGDTLLVFIVLVYVVGRLTQYALGETDLRQVASISMAPERLKNQ